MSLSPTLRTFWVFSFRASCLVLTLRSTFLSAPRRTFWKIRTSLKVFFLGFHLFLFLIVTEKITTNVNTFVCFSWGLLSFQLLYTRVQTMHGNKTFWETRPDEAVLWQEVLDSSDGGVTPNASFHRQMFRMLFFCGDGGETQWIISSAFKSFQGHFLSLWVHFNQTSAPDVSHLAFTQTCL